MKLIDELFYFPGSYWHELPYPVVEDCVGEGRYPLLQELFSRGAPTDFSSGGIWAVATEAPDLLEEATGLSLLVPDGCATGDDYMVRTLVRLLNGSVVTGNPIITHYNGIIDGAW